MRHSNYLNEIIKKTTGYSAGYHIRQRVVLEAKRKAAYSDSCMKEIAYHLGFCDIAHFSKFFKEYCRYELHGFPQRAMYVLNYSRSLTSDLNYIKISMQVLPKKVVIIGGGFAGTNLAKNLAGNKHYDVTLIDKNNYYFFPPLIYQVATSFLEASSISYPFRRIFRGKKNIHFRLGELLRIDRVLQTCYFLDGEITYDFLVFATGAESNYFGIENIRKNAIPMKTIDDALNMRNRLLQTIERACITEKKEEREKLMTIVVAGGG